MPEITQRFREARESQSRIFDPSARPAASERADPPPSDALNRNTAVDQTAVDMEFARSVADGLRSSPRALDCRYLYDAEGSRLFEEITRQPEYYPTRSEASILKKHARDIRERTGKATIVELGSGYSVKTEHILSSYVRADESVDYVPLDVSLSALREASTAIAERFPSVRFTGIHGSYESALPLLRDLHPLLLVFLGSTIGNFDRAFFESFWGSVREALQDGDHVLLGLDLVKDEAPLVAAYDDAAGVSAQFTKNLFVRMNRELGSELRTDAIEHVARWNAEREQIEIHARFQEKQELRIDALDETFTIEAGEEIRTEISRKFRLEKLSKELASFGLDLVKSYTDDDENVAVLLLARRG